MRGASEDIIEKLEEVLLIVDADAVVDPGAVVIHARDASIARGAVVRLWGFERVACFADFAEDKIEVLRVH